MSTIAHRAIFDRLMHQKGGRCNLDVLPDGDKTKVWLNGALAHATNRADNIRGANPKMGEFHIDFVDNANLNAVAFEAEGLSFVGIYLGALSAISLKFHSLLSGGSLLDKMAARPAVRDLPRERNGFPDTEHEAYAELLSFIARDFLTSHELGHLLHGHLTFVRETAGLTAISEQWEADADHRVTNLDRQTLEMDADSFAVAQTIGTCLDMAKEHNHQHFPDEWQTWLSPELMLRSWILAVSSLFAIFPTYGPLDLYRLDTTSHPAPTIRSSMAMGTAATWLKENGLTDLATGFQAVGPFIRIERAQIEATLSGEELTPARIMDPYALLAAKHVDRLLENWRAIRQYVEKSNRARRPLPD